MPLKTPLEARLERKCNEHALAMGWQHIKLDRKKGWPDQLYLGERGAVVIVEFKREGEKPRKLQIHVHSLLKALEFDVHVVDTFEQFCELLRKETKPLWTAKDYVRQKDR